MSTVTEYKEEKSKLSPLAKWVQNEAISGFKTEDEIKAEEARKLTASADYYKKLNAVNAIKGNERQGILDSYDNYFTNNYATLANLSQSRFLGYAFLSYIAQDAFIRRAVTTRADEMTRAWGELTSEDKEKATEDKINFITQELDRVQSQNMFKQASNLTGFFGGCLVYIDMRENPNEPLSDEELATPLYKVGQDEFNKAKLKGLKLVGLQPIEPINIAPSTYNSTDPTAKNFYEPEYFYVLGRKIHKSRFLYFAENIPPQILKPVYLFFGIPLAQIMFPYVQAFYKSKDVVNNVVLKFSCTSIFTDIEGLIATDGDNAVLNRINTIAKYRDNNSVIVLDKNSEDMQQLNTPITGLREILYANLELLPVISGIPTTKFLETSPTGLNATGEYDMRNFYDLINTLQNNTFNEPINKLIDIICYSNGLDSNGLSWTWKPLYQMSDREKAEVNQMKANTSNIYVQMGAITNADVARQLMNDKDSDYDSLEIPEPIDINEQEEEIDMRENGEDTEIDKILKDGVEDEDFKKSDHPRGKDGKFTSGADNTQNPKEEEGEKKSKPIEITGKELGNYKDIKELRQKAIDYYKKNLQETYAHNKELGKIFFSGKGLHKFISSSGEETKLKMIVILKNIIETGKEIIPEEPLHERKDGIVKFYRINNEVKMDGKKYRTSALIGEDEQGNKFYNLNEDVDKWEKRRSTLDAYPSQIGGKKDTSNNIITEKEHFVKPQNEDFLNLFVEEITDEKPSLWKRIKGLFDADRWITIHPPHGNKEDTGIPLKIGEDGEIKAGAGGKFTGKKVGEIRKKHNDNSKNGEESKNYEKTTKKDAPSKAAMKKYLEIMNKPIGTTYQEIWNKKRELGNEFNGAVSALKATIKQEIEKNQTNVNDFVKSVEIENSKSRIDEIKKDDAKLQEELKNLFHSNKELTTEGIKITGMLFSKDISVEERTQKTKEYEEKRKDYEKRLNQYYERKAELQERKEVVSREYAQKVSAYLKNKGITKFQVNVSKTTMPKITKQLQETLSGCLSDDWDSNAKLEIRKTSRRASCNESGIIRGTKEIGTMIHEYAHYLEENNPAMLANSIAFLEYRTQGEDAKKLRDITNIAYARDEKAKPDKFFNPYCGKIYNSSNFGVVRARASEIMSMGMEELFTNPVEFAKKDPEYFNFVIANMRGEL